MAPQDSFIEEDEETCPLCVEDFDLTDRNFRPCPCGYQICQFCFNNIRSNLNGLCPACRRPYDDKTIEYKIVTQEEIAQFKANTLRNAKKKAEQRQKEAQKREVESLNRKHLSGLRVIQKNLVYVIGLSPGSKEDDLLNTLRGDKYFGQYGKIIKILVSKGPRGEVSANGQPSMGIYVTFARKEDAARCIAAVNNSMNGDRVLRAQLGTTKYCSAYLRGETCTNKQCMFLHEPGENEDSYSRQDLSSINSANTQRPLAGNAASSSRQQNQAPIQQAQPVAAATQPMAREASKDGSDSGDNSALPSSASWANRGIQQRSRRGSLATSGAASSPAISQAMPATAEADETAEPSQDYPTDISSPAVPAEVVPLAVRPQRDPVLMELLKTINSTVLIFPSLPSGIVDDLTSYPPLFDDQGGEKRRLMREQQEEVRHLLEPESQTDSRSVPGLVEEEEPESGSLQLGGEPEDRDNGREGTLAPGFQRRSSSQMPISRGTNGGPFSAGLGQGFPQNINTLSSINGHTLSPLQQQQLALLKSTRPQSGFGDQYPPSMGASLGQGSAVFQQQQQGHNRQSSRYSFANDNSSAAATVKPSANPKFLAQQTTMMPSTQQGGQFYGSSMPGPPPGLKSTGTPPVGFGQNHAFGGSMAGGSMFGGAGKDNDMLQNMLRGRNSAGGGQVHDAGKRELMFPSFLSQYPSASSTPAPASNLLASLYGPQTGAFHDFGQKQKKKGKKHRHANTSSSGGSGLVDLADPSILQARMQHQQQSNAGVGHGLFGGQAQDDTDLPSLDEASLDEASHEVDALVADDDIAYRSFAAFDRISRSSTPSVPPGFSIPLPHAHPIAPGNTQVTTPVRPVSRIVPTSAPFTPSRGIVPRAATPLTIVSVPTTPVQATVDPKVSETSKAKAKESLKDSVSNTGLSSAIASQASVTSASLQQEDFPSLEQSQAKSGTTSALTKSSTAKPTPVVPTKMPVAPSSSNAAVTPSATKANEKRPGILNISVPSKPASKPAAVPEPAAKPSIAPSLFPPLPASTPAAVQSPVVRATPKTLRLMPTPKTEAPATGSATPSSTVSMFPQTFAPSRQASIASNTRFERPGTPSSEIISDNASITSASISRPGSPPPSKVGSAPVRAQTKSMQKKQRKEIQREKEKLELEAAASKPDPEPEIGPIMGRKKKQKKERNIHSAAGGSTPAISRPATPGHVDPANDEPKSVAEIADPSAHPSGSSTPVVEDVQKSAGKSHDAKGKGKAKGPRPPTPEPASAVTKQEEELESAEKPIPSPAAVLQELISCGMLQDVKNLNFFKPPNVSLRNQETSTDMQNSNPKLTISAEDRAELLAGRPVFKHGEGGSRIMLTPNGDCVRNLTPEEEQRYLELQARLVEDAGPAAFFFSKHHANNGFTLIGGRAVPNGPPPFFPLTASSIAPLDPVSKIQRDEALNYINQFVLPSLSNNSQLEKALNANALDAEMLRANESSTWASWGNDPAAPPPDNAGSLYSGHEGILATGLESMTAHFAIGKDMDRGQPLGNVSLLSLPEAEGALQIARKETENLEKRFNTILKKNRRLLLGTGH